MRLVQVCDGGGDSGQKRENFRVGPTIRSTLFSLSCLVIILYRVGLLLFRAGMFAFCQLTISAQYG